MILRELRDYIKQRNQVEIGEIASHFDTDPDALRGMIDHMIRKGQVQKLSCGSACSSSSCCSVAISEVFQWTGKGSKPYNCSQ